MLCYQTLAWSRLIVHLDFLKVFFVSIQVYRRNLIKIYRCFLILLLLTSTNNFVCIFMCIDYPSFIQHISFLFFLSCTPVQKSLIYFCHSVLFSNTTLLIWFLKIISQTFLIFLTLGMICNFNLNWQKVCEKLILL